MIEDNLGDGAIALFLQGCGGDINPVGYKDVHEPRDAEPLGNMLGLSALKAVRKIECRDAGRLTVINETWPCPAPTSPSASSRSRPNRLGCSSRCRGPAST